jgi:hypothetical protein
MSRCPARFGRNLELARLPAIIPALGLVAQLVEQRIENPCVGGSIPPRATMNVLAETPIFMNRRFCFWGGRFVPGLFLVPGATRSPLTAAVKNGQLMHLSN